MSELARAGCVLLTLRLVSLVLQSFTAVYSEVSSLCQTPSDSEGGWPIIARSIGTHTFLPWRLLSIEQQFGVGLTV